MNPFDQISRFAAKLDSAGFLAWLLGDATGLTLHDWLDTRTTNLPGVTDRTSDIVAELVVGDVGPWWAVPIEFQVAPDPEMFGRLLEYLGRLWREERPPGPPGDRYEVGAVVVNLTGRGRTSREMRAGPMLTAIDVIEWNMADKDAAATLKGIAEGRISRAILPWVALMQGGDESDILERWKELALAEPNSKRRSDYGACAQVLAEASKRAEPWKVLLKGWNMIESQTVLEWKAEGAAEGRAEGRVEGKAESILDLLRLKFKQHPSADLSTLILANKDLTRAQRWFESAVAAASLEDFQKVVAAG